jgi:hypothetical protein
MTLKEYRADFEKLVDRLVPSIAKTLLIVPLAALGLMIYGVLLGGPLGFLSGLFLAFFALPGVVIFRHLDTRAYVEVEEIVIKEGTATHRQYSMQIKEEKTYTAPGDSGRTFAPGDLYRDTLKRRKWIYYFLMGYRARCVLVYSGDSKTPTKYVAPAVPGEILYTAHTTTLLKTGLGKVWEGKSTTLTLILVVVLVIAVLLGVSWLQASGMMGGV